MDNKKVYASLIIASLLWGFATPIGKYVVEYLPVPVIIYLRFVISAIIVGIVAFALKVDFKTSRREFVIISIAGITTALTMGLFYSSLNFISATEAAILFNTVPIFTILATLVFLKGRPSKFDVIGIILAFIGTIIVIGKPFFQTKETASFSLIGTILMLSAVVMNVASSFATHRIPSKSDLMKVMFIMFSIGAFCALPFLFLDFHTNLTRLTEVNNQAILGMVYIALFATLIPTLLWTYGLERVSPNQVNVFVFLQPVASILLAIPLLGESIDLFVIGGLVAIFGGLYIATKDDEQQALELKRRASGKYHKHL